MTPAQRLRERADSYSTDSRSPVLTSDEALVMQAIADELRKVAAEIERDDPTAALIADLEALARSPLALIHNDLRRILANHKGDQS